MFACRLQPWGPGQTPDPLLNPASAGEEAARTAGERVGGRGLASRLLCDTVGPSRATEPAVEPYMVVDLVCGVLALDAYQELLFPVSKNSRGHQADPLPLAGGEPALPRAVNAG